MSDPNSAWLEASLETANGYRRVIDAAVEQLTDEQFFHRPATNANSVAVLLRHLGGNLQSRWDQFLTEDGEKPSRDREKEFKDWHGDRSSLIEYFDVGWHTLISTLKSLADDDLTQLVTIRGEAHTIPQAIQRSLTHISYHVGQLLLIARMVHNNDETWNWVTIPPGQSKQHNKNTWGTSASRSTFGEK